MKETKKIKEEDKAVLKNVFKDAAKGEKKKGKGEEEGKKRKMTALEEIMEMEKRRKKKVEEEEEEPAAASSPPWLRKNIVVKIVTKSLGDKYYKKKGFVKVGKGCIFSSRPLSLERSKNLDSLLWRVDSSCSLAIHLKH